MNDLRVGHVDLGEDVVEQRVAGDALERVELAADRLDVRGEQRDRRDDRGADGEALGDGLGGVAHRVEAHHDPLGLALELARHLGDAGRVVGDRAEGVLGDDDAGGGEHAHAGEGDHVEGELDVAVAEPDADAERERDAR